MNNLRITRITARQLFLGCLMALSGHAVATQIQVDIELPRLKVAEYHKPYVAVWIEKEGKMQLPLSLWYDYKMKNSEGQKWLKDLRQWWRRGGRELSLPLDGMSSATRPPGKHKLLYSSLATLESMPAGRYLLVVEAVREVGGRELLSFPFDWPPQKAESSVLKGQHELGSVMIRIEP